MTEKTEIRAISSNWNSQIELMLRQGKSVATDIIMTTREQGMTCEPFIKIDMATAQTLIDDLWIAGLRPSEGTGSAGSFKATEKHLNDMRKIVSKELEIDL